MNYIEYNVKVYYNGTKLWYLNGRLHREDGPAIEDANGHKEWYINGQRHREDGPAIEWVSGSKSWCLNGEYLTEEQWKDRLNKNTCHNKIVEIEGKKYKLVEQ